MIKGILFDYGGTIDTNGIHWAEVIWEHYQKYNVPVDRALFLDAYRFGERALAINKVVEPLHHFYDVMMLKIGYQFEWLLEKGVDLASFDRSVIAEDCAYFAEYAVQRAVPVLRSLAQSYPLAVVSNFYGNITTVLEDFGILGFFKSVVESAVVGVRKPDPEIYRLGVQALELEPGECVVVGDSFSKDIVPARQAGCQTIWLKGVGFVGEEGNIASGYESDLVISDLTDLPGAMKELSGVLKTAN